MADSETAAKRETYSKHWLRRFMLGMVITAGTIALLMWVYSLWGYLAVVQVAREGLARADAKGVVEAVVALETPHVFSGFEPYHGFGTEKGKDRAQRIDAMVARGTDYTPDEQAYLTRQIAYFIPAFIRHRGGEQPALVAGDRAIAASLLERWENALASGIAFAIHASLVTLLFGLLFFAYLKLGHFQRFAESPPATQ